jgi:hypothetical protein
VLLLLVLLLVLLVVMLVAVRSPDGGDLVASGKVQWSQVGITSLNHESLNTKHGT